MKIINKGKFNIKSINNTPIPSVTLFNKGVKHCFQGIHNQNSNYLIRRVTAPATTGDATLVPDNVRQPPLI